MKITTYYLEMASPAELRPARMTEATLTQAERVGSLNRRLYVDVGSGFHWTDRLAWTETAWQQYAERPDVQTWLMRLGQATVGYYELNGVGTDAVLLAYFGVLPEYIGQGFGGHMLTHAVQQAWTSQPRRVWVHTCTLDHKNALPAYQARGFRVYEERQGTLV